MYVMQPSFSSSRQVRKERGSFPKKQCKIRTDLEILLGVLSFVLVPCHCFLWSFSEQIDFSGSCLLKWAGGQGAHWAVKTAVDTVLAEEDILPCSLVMD